MVRFLRRFLLISLLLFLGVAAWAAYYGYRRGFSESWRELIEAEFARRGYDIEIERVSLDPFHGLSARNVRFFPDAERRKEIAKVNEVLLDLDLSRILKKDISINTLDVRDAEASLPIDPLDKDSEQLTIKGLSGRLVVTESQIEIVRAEALLEGVAVTVKGVLTRLPKEEDEDKNLSDPEKKRKRKMQLEAIRTQRHVITGFLDQLALFDYQGPPPKLDLEFNGDTMHLGSLRLGMRLEANHFKRGTWACEKLEVEAEYEGARKVLTTKVFRLRDSKGVIEAHGELDLNQRKSTFDLESTADLQGLIGAFYDNPKLGEVAFYEPPRITMEGAWYMDHPAESGLPFEVLGKFRCNGFGTRGQVFTGMECDFSMAGEKFYLRNLRLDHKTGVAFVNALLDKSGFRYQTEVKMDPLVFLPFLNPQSVAFLNRWTFEPESACFATLEGGGPEMDPHTWKSQGDISLRKFRFNGVPFDQLETKVTLENKKQQFTGMRLTKGEKVATGDWLIHDQEASTWTFSEVKWPFGLGEQLYAFSPNLKQNLHSYRFKEPPLSVINGVIDERSPEALGDAPRKSDFSLAIKSDSEAEYDFLGKTLPLSKPSGVLRFRGDGLSVEGFKAGLYGGQVSFGFVADDLKKSRRYHIDAMVDGVAFRPLANLYGSSTSTEGDISGRLEISGELDKVRTMEGSGEAKIRNGDLFAIPLFGPLSKLVSEVLPVKNVGYSVAREASAKLQIRNGVLMTDDFKALTNTFQFEGGGSVDMADQSIIFNTTFNTRFLPTRIVLTPVSKILEFTCHGTLSDPQWRPKYLPKMQLPKIDSPSILPKIPVIGRFLPGSRTEEREKLPMPEIKPADPIPGASN